MGRPRKRRFVDSAIGETDHQNEHQIQELLAYSANEFDFSATIAEPYNTVERSDSAALFQPMDLKSTATEEGRVVWHFGDKEIMAGPPIDFGALDLQAEDAFIPPVDQVPQLSAGSSTASQNSPPQSTEPLPPCSCLSAMYLSLASLQQFPSDIVPALAAVRGACATAANSLWCPQCGSVLLDTATPPIEAFQNTMLLGTILPIIANGYGRLLKMIDAETDLAVANGQTKQFRYHDYGGLCGRQQSIEQAMTCTEKELMFNAVEMPPAQWRTTVRALLRVDIYGHEQPGFKHKGLKDLVDEMEYRQRTRHEMMDAQIADGTLDPSKVGHGFFSDGSKCLGERTRGCLEILKMAKVAIDNLVIA